MQHGCLTKHTNQGNRVTEVLDSSGDVVETDVKDVVESAFLAIAFLFGASKDKYGELINGLANSCLVGRDKYFADVATAYNLLLRYRGQGDGKM